MPREGYKNCANCKMRISTKRKNPLCPMCAREEKETPSKILPDSVPGIFIRELEKNPQPEFEYEKNGSVFFYGPHGVGKTFKAASLMFQEKKRRNEDGQSYLNSFAWINVAKLILEIRNSFNAPIPAPDGFRTEMEVFKYYSEVDWLCLDDLGAEKTSEFTLQTLYLIINERYERERITVITSNTSLDQLSQYYESDRICSRIAGMCEIIEITGKDRRLGK